MTHITAWWLFDEGAIYIYFFINTTIFTFNFKRYLSVMIRNLQTWLDKVIKWYILGFLSDGHRHTHTFFFLLLQLWPLVLYRVPILTHSSCHLKKKTAFEPHHTALSHFIRFEWPNIEPFIELVSLSTDSQLVEGRGTVSHQALSRKWISRLLWDVRETF